MTLKNQLKTALLLGILTAILLFIGSFFGKSGLTIAIIFVLAMNILTYFFSDKLILAMYRAKETTKKEHPELHKIVEEICKTANIPKPKIFIIPTDTPNAFCCGRNPKNASIAFTKGILNLLNKNELKGVAAHELAHDKNRDILIATIAATVAGIISYVAMMARYATIFGDKDRDSGNVIQLLLLSILAPIIALLLQLAISRSREYIADETGAKFIKDPVALASALGKLEKANSQNPLRFGNPSTSSLFIVKPFRGSAILNLFSTHPDINSRIQRLKELKI